MDSAIARASFVEDDDLRICPTFGVAYQADFSAGRVEYGEDYFAKVCAYEGGEIANRVNAGRCEMLARNLPAGAQVLDYGAGSGAFMRAAWEAGFEAQGFDVIPETERWLRAVGRYSDDLARFDAVTLWDVLEHLERPADPLAQLRPGAFAFVSVPIFADLLRVRESRHYRPGEHLYYWTANGLTAWMAVQGFRLIESSRHEIEAGRDSIGAFCFRRA